LGELVQFAKAQVAKVDQGLGLVFGWAIVCTEKGADHYDLQGDHIPEPVMLAGTSDFMEHARVGKEMHRGDQIGTVVHSLPLTGEIAKSLGIQSERTGWIVAMKPSAAVLEKFVSGEYTGFSVGGMCAFEPVAEAA
jgi:hypothetical protein